MLLFRNVIPLLTYLSQDRWFFGRIFINYFLTFSNINFGLISLCLQFIGIYWMGPPYLSAIWVVWEWEIISSKVEDIRMQGVTTEERQVKSTYLRLKPYFCYTFSIMILTNTSAINWGTFKFLLPIYIAIFWKELKGESSTRPFMHDNFG